MAKTAVQLLLDWLEEDSILPGFNERYKAKVQEILNIEMRQITQAYSYGWRLAMAINEHKPEDPEGYYYTNYSDHGTGKSLPGGNPGERTSEIPE